MAELPGDQERGVKAPKSHRNAEVIDISDDSDEGSSENSTLELPPSPPSGILDDEDIEVEIGPVHIPPAIGSLWDPMTPLESCEPVLMFHDSPEKPAMKRPPHTGDTAGVSGRIVDIGTKVRELGMRDVPRLEVTGTPGSEDVSQYVITPMVEKKPSVAGDGVSRDTAPTRAGGLIPQAEGKGRLSIGGVDVERERQKQREREAAALLPLGHTPKRQIQIGNRRVETTLQARTPVVAPMASQPGSVGETLCGDLENALLGVNQGLASIIAEKSQDPPAPRPIESCMMFDDGRVAPQDLDGQALVAALGCGESAPTPDLYIPPWMRHKMEELDTGGPEYKRALDQEIKRRKENNWRARGNAASRARERERAEAALTQVPLEEGLTEYCHWVRTCPEERAVRHSLVSALRTEIHRVLGPDCHVMLVGSTGSGLDLSSSDVDITVMMGPQSPRGRSAPSSARMSSAEVSEDDTSSPSGIKVPGKGKSRREQKRLKNRAKREKNILSAIERERENWQAERQREREVLSTPGKARDVSTKMITELSRHLLHSARVASVQAITSARVPIVKGISTEGVQFDISFNQPNGIIHVSRARELLDMYTHAEDIYCLLKAYLRNRGLNEPWTGGIGGYVLLSMLIAYMQARDTLRPYPLSRDKPITTLLFEFFEFYAIMFNEREIGIDVGTANSPFFKRCKRRDLERTDVNNALCVVDPETGINDIGGGCGYVYQSTYDGAIGYIIFIHISLSIP
ncbi:hypothetical protein KIPB_007673 [Kipferlia bialata]|uniref:Polynucleotide adenylyltransferase n=1 Tax=Kipferlia bialata TaxID=797122 RepID=A0A9K3CZJ1_9EUKA|nr:hypothetical protein KIPB_007673 [Kipferlia bialata]|eukprot:g7673.t1